MNGSADLGGQWTLREPQRMSSGDDPDQTLGHRLRWRHVAVSWSYIDASLRAVGGLRTRIQGCEMLRCGWASCPPGRFIALIQSSVVLRHSPMHQSYSATEISAMVRSRVTVWVSRPLTTSLRVRIAVMTDIPRFVKNPTGTSPPAFIGSCETSRIWAVVAMTVTLGRPTTSLETTAPSLPKLMVHALSVSLLQIATGRGIFRAVFVRDGKLLRFSSRRDPTMLATPFASSSPSLKRTGYWFVLVDGMIGLLRGRGPGGNHIGGHVGRVIGSRRVFARVAVGLRQAGWWATTPNPTGE